MSARDIDIERAEAQMSGLRLSVRIDGEWCPKVRWYSNAMPVFIAEDGSEVDILDGMAIRYETPDGAVQEFDEPDVDKEAKWIYFPLSIYPADGIEVRDVARRPVRSEPADFGGGDSTGVQSL